MFIGVIGEGTTTIELSTRAEEVGQEIARRGHTVICGGLGGVMEAACKGAKEAGGRTVGLLPGNRREDANPYVDVPIITGMGEARNVLVVKSSQVVIAIGGRYGTLSEIALALKLGIPVIGLDTWELAKNGMADDGISIATEAIDAVQMAEEFARLENSQKKY